MAKERKAYAPFSLTSEAGVAQTPVEGYIDVRQEIYPTVSTGTINENGKWTGVKSNDNEFLGITRYELIANGGEVLGPDTSEFPSINMQGFKDLFIAFKPETNSLDIGITAIRGPDTIRFANLSPVNAGKTIKGNLMGQASNNFNSALIDGSETFAADFWSIISIQTVLKDQQNMQFKIVNNSGGARTFEFAFMRLV
jgi:hypothetical protein